MCIVPYFCSGGVSGGTLINVRQTLGLICATKAQREMFPFRHTNKFADEAQCVSETCRYAINAPLHHFKVWQLVFFLIKNSHLYKKCTHKNKLGQLRTL